MSYFEIIFDVNHNDFDGRKIASLYYEFVLQMIGNIATFMHALLLVMIRGLNLSIVVHMLIAKQGWSAFHKMFTDINKFQLFRKFLINLDKDFPQVVFYTSPS